MKRKFLCALLILCVLSIPLLLWMHHRPSAINHLPSTIVYITDTGECYHRASCNSLRRSRHEATLQDAVKDGYRPCHRCRPPELE